MQKRPTALLLLAFALAACGDDAGKPPAEENKQGPSLVIGGEDASEQTDNLYQMPTPNELFAIVRQLNGQGHKNALSPALKADRFVTLPGRALNFGVYATDMVYASNFKLTSEVVRYYLACKDLGEQLGLTTAFNAEVQRRLERNLAHGDSLDVLTNDAYYGAYQKLQDEKMGTTLDLVLAGGWIESMHLVMTQMPDFDAGSALAGRVAEQKVSLEQLIDMMEVAKGDAGVEAIRLKLMAVRDIYDQLNVVRTPHQGTSPSGRMVLGDDVSVTLTEDKYNELKTAIGLLREEITRAEDANAKPNS